MHPTKCQPGNGDEDVARPDHHRQRHADARIQPQALHRQRLRGLPVADELARSIRQQMRDAFYVNTPEWRAQIVSQARQGLFQAISGLTDDRG